MFSKLLGAGSLFVLLFATASATAKEKCPEVVLQAVEKAYPAVRISGCKPERVKGKTQYEVKFSTKDSKALELDISPSGEILVTEEEVDSAAIPAVVGSAFASKYPHSTILSAEKQSKADGSVTYELRFTWKGKKREATFDQDGAFRGVE